MEIASFKIARYEWKAPNGAIYAVQRVGDEWLIYAHKPALESLYKGMSFQSYDTPDSAMDACVGHYATLQAAMPDAQVSP